jgi:hypothetical protein
MTSLMVTPACCHGMTIAVRVSAGKSSRGSASLSSSASCWSGMVTWRVLRFDSLDRAGADYGRGHCALLPDPGQGHGRNRRAQLVADPVQRVQNVLSVRRGAADRTRPEPGGEVFSGEYFPDRTPPPSGLQGVTPRPSSLAMPNSSPSGVRCRGDYSTCIFREANQRAVGRSEPA